MKKKKENWKQILRDAPETRLFAENFVEPRRNNPYASLSERLHWRNIVFAVLVFYFAVCFMTGCYTIVGLKAQENVLVAQCNDALADNEKMKENVAWMKTDAAVETVAREQLGMVQPGEILITQKDENV